MRSHEPIYSEMDQEGQQNRRRRSLTKHYDVILNECFVYHSPPCILLPFWIFKTFFATRKQKALLVR